MLCPCKLMTQKRLSKQTLYVEENKKRARIFLNGYCYNWLFYKMESLALQCFTSFLINCFQGTCPKKNRTQPKFFYIMIMNYFNTDLLNETILTFYDFPQEALYFKQLCIFELTRLLFKKLYVYIYIRIHLNLLARVVITDVRAK